MANGINPTFSCTTPFVISFTVFFNITIGSVKILLYQLLKDVFKAYVELTSKTLLNHFLCILYHPNKSVAINRELRRKNRRSRRALERMILNAVNDEWLWKSEQLRFVWLSRCELAQLRKWVKGQMMDIFFRRCVNLFQRVCVYMCIYVCLVHLWQSVVNQKLCSGESECYK